MQIFFYSHCCLTVWLCLSAMSEVYCLPPREVEQGYVVAVQKTEYEVGFDIHYLCKKNYLLDGPQKVTCLSNGSWSAPPPYCRGEKEIEKEKETVKQEKHHKDAQYMCTTVQRV